MFAALEAWVISYASVMPLPVFAALSSFVEEIVAPIPSGPVMLVMGSLANLQGYTLLALAGLILIAALGKLAGSLVVYLIADKAEDLLSGRFGKMLGVTHAQIEAFGKRLEGGWKDYVLLTVLRALPFVPSAVISAGCGILKVPLRLYVIATLVGSVLRDAFFIYIGYIGLSGADQILARLDSAETLLQVLIVVGVLLSIGALAYLRYSRSKKR
ncbi:MAG: VTT domain-containing protein [Patescibacteria group bacterium]